MKVIFSRKGFDDAYGGQANLILPDGRLLVFPIPEMHPYKGVPYENIKAFGRPLSQYFSELNIALPANHTGAHLDPDIKQEALSERHDEWRPVFGSHGSANTHLRNEGIGPGDLFLFFGSFRPVEISPEGLFRYLPVPAVHIIFSWMRVGKVFHLSQTDEVPEWCGSHPHVVNQYGLSNTLYLSHQDDNGRIHAGPLDWREDRVLTRGGFRKSQWLLPYFFHPEYGTRISRHSNPDRFVQLPGSVMLDTVSIGQDFVVHGDERVIKWALDRVC